MRIDQIVASYQQQNLRQAQGAAGSTAPGLDAATKANQARLSDASKGFLQASKVRDGVAAVSDAVSTARNLVEKAKDTSLSAADRAKLQADFSKALAAADQGGKDQGAAIADKKLANKTFDATKVQVVSSDQLGKNVSSQFSSVADLKKLDLAKATPDQLAEAAKVLDQAATESKAKLATADAQDGRASRQVDKFQAVVDTLSGNANQNATQQRNLAAIQALNQQTAPSLVPGSLFNMLG